jgi:elongation factor 1-gamma
VQAVEDLHKALTTLERHLLSRTYMVGEAITLADIVLVSALFYPFKLVLDGGVREAYPSVTRWFYTCVNQPQFTAVLGDVPLCEEALVAAGGSAEASAAAAKRALAAGAAAAGAGAGKKADKADKPKKEAAPKAEKPKAEKKEKAPKEEDADAPPPADIPKEVKKDPFGGLAKTTLNLDEWKRHYSNTKPHIGAMPWFWEHLDREGWSVWRQDYNYNNENTRDFMTSNLVGASPRSAADVAKCLGATARAAVAMP